MIGIFNLIVEPRRKYIGYEVSVISSYLVKPRRGHILQPKYILKYLGIHKGNKLALDPEYHNICNPNLIKTYIKAMNDMRPHSWEDLPQKTPKPYINVVDIDWFVNSGHTSDIIKIISQTVIFLYCNSATTIWYSKI